MAPPGKEELIALGFPLRPGPKTLLQGDTAIEGAWAFLSRPDADELVESNLLAAWLGALRTDFPSRFAERDWPSFAVTDRGRYLKFRRIVRGSLAQMF